MTIIRTQIMGSYYFFFENFLQQNYAYKFKKFIEISYFYRNLLLLIFENQTTTLFIYTSAYAQIFHATSYIIIQTHRLTLPLVQYHMRLKTVKYHLLSGSYLVIVPYKDNASLYCVLQNRHANHFSRCDRTLNLLIVDINFFDA